jgi:sulfane dehydrogenase subunit SoxC
MIAPSPVDASCSVLHGLVSGSEWSGVPLALLLEEAGVKPSGKWIIASGADAAGMSRSIPLSKIYDDAIVALYQNGERLRPGNGYPMRLFLPGWEGNASVKWLKTLQVTNQPAMTKDETSKYSDLGEDGRAELFTFKMGVKSLITSPSPGLDLAAKGLYQISGIAWSGAGHIKRVEVSTDAGKTWAEGHLDAEPMSKSLSRFRAAWRWQGQRSVLLSRATDEAGQVQPTRTAVLKGRAPGSFYHYNGIQAWQVDANGAVRNVYV